MGLILNPYIQFPQTGGINNPTDIPNILNWNDVSQLSYANDDNVDIWNDYSGNGNNIIRNSPTTARPTFKTNVQNGLPGLLFDGNSDHMDCLYGATIPQPLTFAFVINPSAGSDNIHDSNINGRIATVESSGNILMFAGTAAGTGIAYPTTPSILLCFYDGSSSYIRLNGVSSSTVNPGSDALGDMLMIGANETATVNWFSGYNHELIIYQRIINPTETTDLEGFLSSKWDIPVS